MVDARVLVGRVLIEALLWTVPLKLCPYSRKIARAWCSL
jgi:hypothetical protein